MQEIVDRHCNYRHKLIAGVFLFRRLSNRLLNFVFATKVSGCPYKLAKHS